MESFLFDLPYETWNLLGDPPQNEKRGFGVMYGEEFQYKPGTLIYTQLLDVPIFPSDHIP